jgi:hypothetical protein
MPDCEFSLELDPGSTAPSVRGNQFTIRMNPPLKPGCRFTVSMNNQAARPGDNVGALRLVGVGATGTATFQALADRPVATVTFTLTCEDCGPTPKSFQVGRAAASPPSGGIDWGKVLEALGKSGACRK